LLIFIRFLLELLYSGSEAGRFSNVPAEFPHKLLPGILTAPASESFGTIQLAALDGLEAIIVYRIQSSAKNARAGA